MRSKAKVFVVGLMALVVPSAFAGGSWEAVRVVSFRPTSEVDYVLVIDVVPRGPSDVQWQDPMFRGCNRLEVHGTFRPLRAKGKFAWFVDTFSPPEHPFLTKSGHMQSIAYLQLALAEKRTINFGYIGTGFVPLKAEEPCVVASRSLELVNERGSTAVVSYHNDF